VEEHKDIGVMIEEPEYEDKVQKHEEALSRNSSVGYIEGTGLNE
jgi:hypothetical protein